jgi:F-type H+-transporting ATPase subunit gamma
MALEQTQRRRKAVGTIHDLVGAMRAIAAGRIQGAQGALATARRYQDVVQRGLAALADQATTRWLPAVDGRPPLLMVFTAEQPFCGAFNHNVLTLAIDHWQQLRRAGPASLVVVGQRGARLLAARGVVADGVEPGATSLAGLRDLVKRLASRVDAGYAAGQAGPLHVVCNRYRSVSEQVPTAEIVLPLDLSRLPPAGPNQVRYYRYLPVPALLAGLVSEHAFISLYRTAAESYAGEQASRLVAMDGATRNTERMLDSLLDLERRERQGQITRQVLDLLGARFVQ